jgi:hypothetical protein
MLQAWSGSPSIGAEFDIHMRVLLYGMQSSGASILAFTLAQNPASLAFVDIWNMFAAPELETDRDCVAKAVVTTAFSLELHRRRFRPDVTVLFLRHPVDNYESLFGKSYANEAGLIDEKFSVLEEVFRGRTGFDHIVHYEDFVLSPRSVITLFDRLGWHLGFDALLFGRSQREIEEANAAACPGLQKRLKYGAGNLRTGGVLRDRLRFSKPWGKSAHLPKLCPSLFEHYAAERKARNDLWHMPSRALLSCNLGPILRELTRSGPIPEKSERADYRLQFIDWTSQSRVTDKGLVLSPGARGTETRLVLSGLPGRPFNRVCATAYAEHPLGAGTVICLRIDGAVGESLAEQEFTLRHSDMKSVDLAFEPPVPTVSLSLSVRLADDVDSADHAGICFQDLRLEQAVR